MCTFHLSVGFSLCGVVVQADFVSAVYMGIPASASTGFRLSHTLQCQPMTMCVCVDAAWCIINFLPQGLCLCGALRINAHLCHLVLDMPRARLQLAK
jgi:hypothetical protein